MLDAVPELRQHSGRDVLRCLGDEEHPHALAADEAHGLLDLLEKVLARIGEEQVRLVEEEDQLGLVEIAHLGQVLEQVREQPP